MKLKNKKALGLFLSFTVVLCIVTPATLAIETDADVSSDSFIIRGELTDGMASIPDTDEIAADNSGTTDIDGTSIEGNPAAEGEASVESKTPAEGEATDNNASVEKENIIEYIDGCSDECDGTDCECDCHLFDRLMDCESLNEIFEMINGYTDEELFALLSEDKIVQVEDKIQSLEPQPLPEIKIGDDGKVIAEEPKVEKSFVSEIIYPTVNFDDVAPFGDPVVGR